MFGRKKNNRIEVTKLSSLVADNMHIIGDVHFSGGLRIDGIVEGNVYGKPGTKGLLVLSEKGVINGKVQAYDAVINGNINGDLEVEHFAELQISANVVGNVRYRHLQLDCGATVEGKLVRIHEDAPPSERRPADRPATVMPVGAPAGRLEPAAASEGRPAAAVRPAAVTPRTEPAAPAAGPDKDKAATQR